MAAYYNEIDPFKAEVLREAIKAGAIAPGDVDERSIADVQPADLVGYTQCHFFAGGGFWSLALRLAGWPDNRPVWTGSCPCPSFSAAGKGAGFDDPRHLWPTWFALLRQCRPRTVFGEQVAAAIGHGWLDLVCGDLEAEGYAVAAAVLGAHSVGAPHIRQRLYFGAHAAERGSRAFDGQSRSGARPESPAGGRGVSGQLAHPDGGQSGDGGIQRGGEHGLLAADCGAGRGADTERRGIGGGNQRGPGAARRQVGEPQDRPCAANELGDRREDALDRSDTAQRGFGIAGSAPGNAGHAAQPDAAGELRNADGTRCEAFDLQRIGNEARSEYPAEPSATGHGSDAEGAGLSREPQSRLRGRFQDGSGERSAAERGSDANRERRQQERRSASGDETADGRARWDGSEPDGDYQPSGDGETPGSDNSLGPRLEGHSGDAGEWRGPGWLDPLTARSVAAAGATRGFWAGCDWWYGRDGKYRPAGPGIFPLAHGSPARVGRLRLYGDAICVPAAQAFVEAWLAAAPQPERQPVAGSPEAAS